MSARKFTHKPTGNTGAIYGRINKVGRVHCLLDSGEFAWLQYSELELVPLKSVRRVQPEPSLLRASQLTGKAPDDLLHLAKMNGLTVGQVVEALA